MQDVGFLLLSGLVVRGDTKRNLLFCWLFLLVRVSGKLSGSRSAELLLFVSAELQQRNTEGQGGLFSTRRAYTENSQGRAVRPHSCRA